MSHATDCRPTRTLDASPGRPDEPTLILVDRLSLSLSLPLDETIDAWCRIVSAWVGHAVFLSGRPHLVTTVCVAGGRATVTLHSGRGDGLDRCVQPGRWRRWFGRVQAIACYSPLPDGQLVQALRKVGLEPTPQPYYAGHVRFESALTLWRGPVGAVARWWYRRRGM